MAMEAAEDTRSEYLLEMCRDAKGYGSGPMGSHKTVFADNLCGSPLLMNIPVTLGASILLWGTAYFCVTTQDASNTLRGYQTWVTDVFTWMYISSNGIWLFLMIGIYMYYGNVKLGKDGEKPQFDDANYFMMIFCAGVGIGLIYFGVAEPMWHYIEETGANRYSGAGYMNDNELATNAINLTLYHWGVHGWVVYTLTALCLGVLAYRYDLPLTYRTCFFPLFGKATWGWIGDLIDMVTIGGCVAGVCTSLGLGAEQIVTGFGRMGWFQIACKKFPAAFEDPSWIDATKDDWDDDWCLSGDQVVTRRVAIIVVITLVATFSVLSGLDAGIQLLSQVAFCSGMFLWTCAFTLDNTWYILNVMVQSFGYYLQWIIQLGWFTDAFGQLRFGGGRNIDATGESSGTNPSWMDWWTIFYWGWWISWSPFVGVFLARISKGRTVAEVINFTFSVPLIYCIMWFAVFGGAGIKMHREAQLLQLAGEEMFGDAMHFRDTTIVNKTGSVCFTVPATLPCPEELEECPGYSGSNYVAADTSLSPVCLFSGSAADDIWFDLMDHYAGLGWLLSAFSLFTIIVYFVTSSDSGSMVVDLIACNGEEAHPITKIYWAFTEGGLACALLIGGGNDALSALRAVSIIAGVPFTIFVCLICLSMGTTFRYDQGWVLNHEYNTWAVQLYGGIFDWAEFIFSGCKAPRPECRHIFGFFTCGIFPPIFMYLTLQKLAVKTGLNSPGIVQVVGAGVCWIGFVFFVVFSWLNPGVGLSAIAVFFYGGFAVFVVMVRSEVRVLYNIEGSMLTDVLAATFFYPQALWIAFVQCESPLPEPFVAEPSQKKMDDAKQGSFFGRVPSNRAEVEQANFEQAMSTRASNRQGVLSNEQRALLGAAQVQASASGRETELQKLE